MRDCRDRRINPRSSVIDPTRSVRRLVAAALLLLATLGGVATAWADGLAERGARAAVAHVEGEGVVGCPPAHEHAHCGLCRALRDLATLAAAPAAAPPVARTAVSVPTSTLTLDELERARPSARAPPARV